jgi:putative drug exporter of the RND superfamily
VLTLAKFSIKRPKLALGAWLAVAAVLAVIGAGVSKTVSPSITVVKGTQSSRALALGNAEFGPTQLVPIMLEGPKALLDRQGPKLVVALTKRPHTRVLSAWDAGTASHGLRPRPTAAMIVVSVDRSEKTVVQYDQPQIEQLVAHRVTGPVKAYITGQPSIDRALKNASISNLRSTELIAIGVLFLMLLIGLRAPVAAVLVTAVAAISTLAGFGEVALLGHVIKVDPVAVALGTMTGLSLGVGLALMILDRFHREARSAERDRHEVAAAAIRDLEGTGKAVLVGGSALILALALVAVVGPTELIVSLGTGMLTCAAFATGGAVVVMPAALVLLGRRIEWLRFPAPRFLTRAWDGLVSAGGWVTRYAVFTGFAATALLAVLAIPAFALKSGPPDVSQLPAGAHARIAFQEISRVMGSGWATPYNMIVVSKGRPVTAPAMLAQIDKLQTRIAHNKTVYSVVGPGAINSTSDELKSFGPQLAKSAAISDKSKKDLLTLIDGLGQAGSGASQLQSGLASASSGASQLNSGSGQAGTGAGQLHAGLAQAKSGSATLQAGLNRALSGAQALKAGAGQALNGSTQLVRGLSLAQTPASQSVPALNSLAGLTAKTNSSIAGAQSSAGVISTELNHALASAQAMTTGKTDPNYQALISALQRANSAASGLSGQIGTAASSASSAKGVASAIAYQAPGLVAALQLLHNGASQLQSGVAQLRDGNAQLANGIGQLAGGGGQLHTGLGQLTAGAGALQTGLAQLTSGTGQLATGLAGAVGPTGQLVTGLGQMQAGVIKSRGTIPSTADLRKLERQSPGMFNSGYFVLAAVEGARGSDRNAATFTINLLRGGTAGQVVVVSKYKAGDPRTNALGTYLTDSGRKFAATTHTQVAIGGPAGNLGDLTNVTESRIWPTVIVLALALALVLALALRAVLLPVVATAFSLLVTASAFGLLQLLYGGIDPPLKGPGYLDPMSILGIFTVAFGISVMFAVLLLMRTREAYVAEGGSGHSVRVGLRETAAAATGAGLVMVAALVPFATSDLINVQQFGIGVATVILLEVLIVRPVLLPAAETVLGQAGWWPTAPPPGAGEPEGGSPRHPIRARLHRPVLSITRKAS